MSGSQPHLIVADCSLRVNHEYLNFSDFKSAVHRWATTKSFPIKFQKSNKTLYIIVCAVEPETCAFHVRAICKQKLMKVVVRVVVAEHTACLGVAKGRYVSLNNDKFILKAIPELHAITKKITPRDIQDAVQ